MSRRRMGFADKSAFLRRHRPATLGFGTMSFLLLLIPIVGALVIPFNVAGGTVLFCELLEREEETGDGEPPSPAPDDHE